MIIKIRQIMNIKHDNDTLKCISTYMQCLCKHKSTITQFFKNNVMVLHQKTQSHLCSLHLLHINAML